MDCELRHRYEDKRGNVANLNITAARKVKCEKKEHTQCLFMKKENIMENQTQEKKILIGHPNIDFDMNREIDLKA